MWNFEPVHFTCELGISYVKTLRYLLWNEISFVKMFQYYMFFTCKMTWNFGKRPFIRVILYVAVVLVYVINPWQSMQQDIRIWFAPVCSRCSRRINTYANMSTERHAQKRKCKRNIRWLQMVGNNSLDYILSLNTPRHITQSYDTLLHARPH